MNNAPSRVPAALECPGNRIYDVTALQLLQPRRPENIAVAWVAVQQRNVRWQNLDFIVYVSKTLVQNGSIEPGPRPMARYIVDQVRDWLIAHPGYWGLSNLERFVYLVCDAQSWVFVP